MVQFVAHIILLLTFAVCFRLFGGAFQTLLLVESFWLCDSVRAPRIEVTSAWSANYSHITLQNIAICLTCVCYIEVFSTK